MKFDRIDFQPFQVLTAKNLNDLQDALEEAIPEDIKANAFQVNVTLTSNEGNLFYGASDQPYAALLEAVENQQAVQCALKFDIDGGSTLKLLGQLAFSAPDEKMMAFVFDSRIMQIITESLEISDMILMIGQEGSETLAICIVFSTSQLGFQYSNGSYIAYNPNNVDDSVSVNIPSIDSTLKRSGYAADAKAVGDNLAKINTQINDILGGVTEAELNTLKELSDALNDDENFAATITSQLSNAATKEELTMAENNIASNIEARYEDAISYADELVGNIDIKPDIKVYQITTDATELNEIVKLLPDVTIHSGDVMIVTNSMGIKSAYQYDKTWIACDGHVDATSVIMPYDITLAGSYSRVGNLTKSANGTATFSTKGKSVADAFKEMLSKREQPSITSYPAITFNNVTEGSYEVGTPVVPSWDVSLSPGSYTYGPSTGITPTWEIHDTNSRSNLSASGSFPQFVVLDETNYAISAIATYNQGTIAKDNLGDASSPIVRIPANTLTKEAEPITGYRSWFIYIGTNNTATIDSNFIRTNATNMGDGNAASTQNNIAIPAGTKRIIIALPQQYGKTLSSVVDVDGMGLDVIGNFTKTIVRINGYNNYNASKIYDLWVAENANGLTATKYNFIIN